MIDRCGLLLLSVATCTMSRSLRKVYSHICKKDHVEPSSSVQLAFQRMQDSCLDLSTVYITVEQCRVISQTLSKHPVSDLCLSDCLTGDQGMWYRNNGGGHINFFSIKIYAKPRAKGRVR